MLSSTRYTISCASRYTMSCTSRSTTVSTWPSTNIKSSTHLLIAMRKLTSSSIRAVSSIFHIPAGLCLVSTTTISTLSHRLWFVPTTNIPTTTTMTEFILSMSCPTRGPVPAHPCLEPDLEQGCLGCHP